MALGWAEVTDTTTGEPVAPVDGAKLMASSPLQAAAGALVGVAVGKGVGAGGAKTIGR